MIQEILKVPRESVLMLWLTVAFFVIASITTFTKRMEQAKRAGNLPPDEPMPPAWIGIIFWIEIGLKITLFILNWKYGIFIYIIGFILAFLPVLELIGNVLLAPLKWRKSTG